MAPAMTWICWSSPTDCLFHIVQEVGAETKVSKLHTSTLIDQHAL